MKFQEREISGPQIKPLLNRVNGIGGSIYVASAPEPTERPGALRRIWFVESARINIIG